MDGWQWLNPLFLFRLLWHLPDFLKLLYRLFWDRRVPFYLKMLLITAILYVISPVDFWPDFLIPIVGMFDDVIVLFLAAKFFLSYAPREVVLEHVAEIEREKELSRRQ